MARKNSNIVLIVFIFLFLLTGCSLPGKRIVWPGDEWESEVLQAEECGFDRLQCCPGRGSECKFGQQCCRDPKDKNNNFCAEDCSCGILENFCCVDGDECGTGLACLASVCVECGRDNQPCCPGEACGEELVCHRGTCVECGLPGNPCCDEEPACQNQEKLDRSRTECRDDVCIYCGSNSGIACQTEPKCATDHLLNNNFCLNCGGKNQPCCDPESDTGYDCNPSLDLVCELGFCSRPIKY